jgi:hypothetical protein
MFVSFPYNVIYLNKKKKDKTEKNTVNSILSNENHSGKLGTCDHLSNLL